MEHNYNKKADTTKQIYSSAQMHQLMQSKALIELQHVFLYCETF